MKAQKVGKMAIFSVGAVLFSAHAGGGFATGNQANTYYVGIGWTGIVSAIIAMLLLILTMREAMVMYNQRNLTSAKELFENLSARDREILGRKYGAFGYEETSVNDIADYMLITRNAVNKAVNSATEILRKEYHNGSKLKWWRLCNRAVKDALEGRTA